MTNVVKRLNYYDHQFLRAPDFSDEQSYHLSMRRLHNSTLHTWGIVQGLQVSLAGGGTGTAVTVNAGVALDSAGREIVLPSDTNLELGGAAAGATLFITIAYDEQQSDPTTEAGGPGNTRVTESPRLSFSTNAPADNSTTLLLAKVTRTNTGLGPIDSSERKQAGVVLGSELTINTLTLKKDGVAQANWPALSCSAANLAALANAGLTVSGSVGIGPTAPNRNLTISGADGAGVYANVRNANHEVLLGVDNTAILSAMTASDLQIRTNNATRVVVQANSGNVGIGTAAPISELHIRKDAPGQLGPKITVMNGGGGAGASAAIDLSGYDTGAQGPASRIQAVDDGAASAHLVFSSKRPGALANPLVETMRLTSVGNVGIGTTTPGFKLDVSERMRVRQGGTPSAGIWFFQSTPAADRAFVGMATDDAVGFFGSTGASWGLTMNTTTGNVGIGAFPTGVKLFVGGVVQCAQVIGAKVAYVADRFVNKTGDALEQGDILVISGDQTSLYYGDKSDIPIPEVDLAATEYDTKVCGIVVEAHAELQSVDAEKVSGANAPPGGKKSGDAIKQELRMFSSEETATMDITKVEEGQIGLMATLGTYAWCKVDAEIAPIEIGDLLTTSSTKGYAQKILDSSKAQGAVIGKALGSLNKGKGKIPVLVTLQ